MSYALIEDLLQMLGLDNDYDDQHDMQRALDAASGWIEQHTGRVFTVSGSTTKYYYPTSYDELRVEDLQTITSLATDTAGALTYTQLWTATDYELLPLDGPPYQTIRVMPTSSKSFYPYRRAKVVGTFGYSPTTYESATLKQACLLLASRWYHRKDAPFGILGATDLGQFERISKEDPDVLTLLQPLSRAGSASSWIVV